MIVFIAERVVRQLGVIFRQFVVRVGVRREVTAADRDSDKAVADTGVAEVGAGKRKTVINTPPAEGSCTCYVRFVTGLQSSKYRLNNLVLLRCKIFPK